MNATLIWVLVLVVALIVGPFATLRAVSHCRSRRPNGAPPVAKPASAAEPKTDADAEDPDRPSGFW
ncbi:hypothetical protein ED208_08080 [Stagnimonas aquatica]|uniref:Uncharacterized protein n=1 Tax=Stagnimonas aquatica TaxID=2689987 RepID=A0A3N0VDY4_9GAMM|nr:hypothetical protein [Stagnimonas aquatica]ROH90926.1 hypothetical protein ED208_08080 [Stagnimonas aquatica]